jgi:hypothetical protein
MSLGLACKDIGMQWSRGKWIGPALVQQQLLEPDSAKSPR